MHSNIFKTAVVHETFHPLRTVCHQQGFHCVYATPNVTHITLLSLLPICSLPNT